VCKEHTLSKQVMKLAIAQQTKSTKESKPTQEQLELTAFCSAAQRTILEFANKNNLVFHRIFQFFHSFSVFFSFIISLFLKHQQLQFCTTCAILNLLGCVSKSTI
jgi:hypothetical protein